MYFKKGEKLNEILGGDEVKVLIKSRTNILKSFEVNYWGCLDGMKKIGKSLLTDK